MINKTCLFPYEYQELIYGLLNIQLFPPQEVYLISVHQNKVKKKKTLHVAIENANHWQCVKYSFF